MAVYNGEKYIKASIESILKQSFSDFEFIIVNDGSTDKTSYYLSEVKDKRVKVYNLDKNSGVAMALNTGINLANGEYLAIADADDIYIQNRFEKEMDFLDKNKEIHVVGSFVNYFTSEKDLEGSLRFKNIKKNFELQLFEINSLEKVNEYLKYYCCIINSTIMFRRDILKDFKYNSKFTSSMDYELFYNLNKKGYKMFNINEVLANIRVSDDSITGKVSNKNLKSIFNQLYEIKAEEIEKNFKNEDSIFIWGAGGYGSGFLNIFSEKGIKIKGFIDSDKCKWGTKLNGKIINSPDIIYKDKNIKIIVASEPGRIEIVEFLKKNGYNNLKEYISF